MRPGGALVICDDVRRGGNSRKAERAFHRFKVGWHVNSLLGADELRSLAGEAGFAHEATEDLSPYLELRRARDRVIAAAVATFGWLPLGANSPRPPGRRECFAAVPGQRVDRLRPHGFHPVMG